MEQNILLRSSAHFSSICMQLHMSSKVFHLNFIHQRLLGWLQDVRFLEFFAGTGNCWNAVRIDEAALGVDIQDWGHDDDHRFGSNPFDILSPSGFAWLCCIVAWSTAMVIYSMFIYSLKIDNQTSDKHMFCATCSMIYSVPYGVYQGCACIWYCVRKSLRLQHSGEQCVPVGFTWMSSPRSEASYCPRVTPPESTFEGPTQWWPGLVLFEQVVGIVLIPLYIIYIIKSLTI